MQIVSLFIALCLLILIAVYLYAPFLERRARRVTEEEHETSSLLAERERILNSLQELEFDYKLGKVPEEDYPTQRANLMQKGADILRRLDELAPLKAESNQDALIEQKLATRRKSSVGKKADLTDDDLESMISARRKGRKEKSAGFCPKCGKPVLASDKFCPACGKPLA